MQKLTLFGNLSIFCKHNNFLFDKCALIYQQGESKVLLVCKVYAT